MNPFNCPQCGNLIQEDYGFCVACGYQYKVEKTTDTGSANVRAENISSTGPANNPNSVSPEDVQRAQQAYAQYMDTYRRKVLESQRQMSILCLIIWIGMSFSFGLLSFASFDIDYGNLGSDPVFEGTLFLISGLLAVVSTACIAIRKFWQISFFTCLASTFVTAGFFYLGETICIYFILCGLLTSFRVRNIRSTFSS